jgi:carbamoyl-phosphate synthase large subunit
MPKRDDIRSILVIGSGPIVIGQGCEFDYSGAQALKSLKAEGYRVVLVNSNPATIMTDPALSDRTYIEPITPEAVRKIIEKEVTEGEGIDAVLPTLGGQTALNCACALWDDGTLEKFGIEMIGASREVIHRAEDRERFSRICHEIGLATPESRSVHTLEEAREFLETVGLPAIIRPAFTLGGWGGGIAYNAEEFDELVQRGLSASMIHQVQVDRSLIGWKEYELEVVRDRKDNCVVVCGIENIDAMGVHTGDSITVAPILTLSDKEYQTLRDAAFAIMRSVGVETGGSNVQFAVNPNPEPGADGRKRFEFVVVEMNPRVSRSSALASKATGFPIAKIAAKLAVGYTLDELRNDVTGSTSACFEPTIDYVVTKMPRWTFEKFPEADETLTTQMKSVGEAMAIGRTFKESFQKVIRSMDVKRFGFGLDRNDKWLAAMRAVESEQLVLDFSPGSRPGAGSGGTGLRTADGQPIEWPIPIDKLTRKLAAPSQGRPYYIRYALKMGWTVEHVHELTKIDPFFLDQLAQLVEFEDTLCSYASLEELPAEVLLEAKKLGYSDAQLANLYLGRITSETILQARAHRKRLGVEPVYKLVDTCAAEFEAATPYFYSTYEGEAPNSGKVAKWQSGKVKEPDRAGGPIQTTGAGAARAADAAHSAILPLCHSATSEDEIRITDRPKVIILGGGPNRIGQGIEFDYCCVHAALAARELGFESVMINSNPETVSTDYDTSDLLFFEPLTLEDVVNIVERLNGGTLQSGKAAEWQSDEAGKRGRAAAPVQKGDAGARTDGEAAHFATLPLCHSATSSGLVHGCIVQFGGQTPLNLAHGLSLAGAPIIGTSIDSIDLAEDRDRFDDLLERLELKRPASGIARSLEQAVAVAARVGYPVLVRPSYVLGGRGMEICPDEGALRHYINTALGVSDLDDAPVLIDQFLGAATEVDVDVVADFVPTDEGGGGGAASGKVAEWQRGKVDSDSAHSATSSDRRALVCGVMEHIEHAGVHSGDSTCVIPPFGLRPALVDRIRTISRQLAEALQVCGLMNVQMAVKDDDIYILEVNPRASRTAPFVGKAKHTPWPALAAKCMMGRTLAELGAEEIPDTGAYAVKAPVWPFQKFPGVDFVLGPEMKSTGEVMGIDASLPIAYAKALMGAGITLPTEGGVFLSVRDADKPAMVDVCRGLMAMGFTVYTTGGTADFLARYSVRPKRLQKIAAGARPNVLDLMKSGNIGLVINTPTRTGWRTDEGKMRAAAVRLSIPMLTTATAAMAVVRAIEALRAGDWDVKSMQEYAGLAREAVGAV